jgi:hypothetical protein
VRVVSVKDAEEHLLEMRYFGADERPAANRQGLYILRTIWSPSGQVSEEYLGLDGLPVETEIAPGLRCAHRSWTYDGLGHEVEYRTARADGSPCADASGIAARMRRYDGERVVEEQFLDGSGALRAGLGGIARAEWKYDPDGRPVREAFQDGAGMPVAPAEWVSDLAAKYDEYGRLVRFDLAPPLPLGAGGDMLATVEINYQGADALAVPRGPSGNHLIVDGVVALRYPKAEWGGRLGCVGLEGTTMRCAEGTEILLRFLTVQRTVSCGVGSVAPADDRCEWVWAP